MIRGSAENMCSILMSVSDSHFGLVVSAYVVSEPAVTRLNASSLSLAGFNSSAGSLLSNSS